MTEINKAFIYEQLDILHREKKLDTTPYIAKMVGQDDIPYEVIVFINKHLPLEKFTTYNEIYKKRRNSRLYRNIVDDSLPVEEQAIVLSSLLSQSLIGIKHLSTESKYSVIDAINVDIIIDALARYMHEQDTSVITEVFGMFQTIFKTLFKGGV